MKKLRLRRNPVSCHRLVTNVGRMSARTTALAAGLCLSYVAAASEPRLVEGTRYGDVIDESGSDVPVEVVGLGGKDTITGSRFNDIIDGGRHNDTIVAGGGDDTVIVIGADGGIDIVSGGAGMDRILGSSGNDSIGFNRVFGGSESVEVIDGGAGLNAIVGTKYSDVLDFSATMLINIASIEGLEGDDTLTGSSGPDTIEGGPGNDTVYGLAGDDTFLFSGDGADFDLVRGGDGADRILGSAADDVIGLRGYSGANSVEMIDGGAGYDVIAGSNYSDLLDFSGTSLQRVELIDGGGGNDSIVGTGMDDVIAGGDGNDTIDGATGLDTAVFGGARSEYEIYVGSSSVTVVRIVAGGHNETDTLIGVEQMRFADITIPVGGGNQPPVTADDSLNAVEDIETIFSESLMLANDSDPDGDPIHLVSATAIRGGLVELVVGGDVKFTPDPDFNGDAVFTYIVEDDKGGARGATVTVDVAPVNDPPIARDDAFFADIDTELSLDMSELLSNDSDVDAEDLVVASVSNAINGSVSFAQGMITFSPTPGFIGQARFTYSIEDPAGASDSAIVRIDVRESNGIPDARNDTASMAEDDVLSIALAQLLENDTDPDNDPIEVVGVKGAVNGSVSWSANGAIEFRPAVNYFGPAEFTYVISDGKDEAEALVSIDVTPVNDPPVAGPDSFTGNMNSEIVFDPGQFLQNDTDVDGDPIGISAVGGAVNCTVTLNEFGQVVFTPAKDFQGVTSFNYEIDDGANGLAVGLVTVNVGFSFRVIVNNKSTSILQWDGITREFLGELVQRPSDTKQPHSVTVGPDGNVYVGWTGGNLAPASVRNHDPITGEQLSIFSTFEMESDDTSDLLSALAFAPNGQLLVSDNIGLDPDRKMFRFQGLSEPNPGEFVDEFIGSAEYQFGTFKVFDFDFDRNGDLMIPSAAKHEIIIFDAPTIGGGKSRILDIFISAFVYEDRADGVFKRIPGNFSDPSETGFDASRMTEAYGLAWGPDGNLYVAVTDTPKPRIARILYFSPEGKYLGDFVSRETYMSITQSTIRDIDFGPDNNLYVTHRDDGKIIIFGDPTGPNSGKLIDTLSAPSWVTFRGSTSIDFISDE